MTTELRSDLIDEYLSTLTAELNDVPAASRVEIISEMRNHIRDALATNPNPSRVDILNVLDRMGDPAMLAQEERDRLGITRPSGERVHRSGIHEVAAVILTLFLWPVGIILLWSSPVWGIRSKLLGTLLPPGGFWFSWLFAQIVLFGTTGRVCTSGYTTRGHHVHHFPTTCSGGPPEWGVALLIGLLIVLLVMPFANAIYLSLGIRNYNRATV